MQMISKLGQSYLISKDQIDRFAKALAQAVYDSRVEQSQGVKIFYDAEVAVWMAIGFQQLDSYNKHPSERLLLVRALQSAGYLGTVNLLRPHALELDVLIRRQPALSPSGVNQGFSKRVSQFLHSEGIDRHIQNLADILQKAT